MSVPIRVILVMGVSGVGKSTLGSALASALGPPWVFVEGDAFHPEANIRKMSAGVALGDEDRWPWLEALRRRIDEGLARGESVVLACSALKRLYRERLLEGLPAPGALVAFMVSGAPAIREAMRARQGAHFMPAALLDSQLAALEPPLDDEPWIGALVEVPAYQPVAAQVGLVRVGLARPGRGLR
ncbi:MAG: gluconokinase [Phycisphaerales bacterium]